MKLRNILFLSSLLLSICVPQYMQAAATKDGGPWKVVLKSKITQKCSIAGFLNEKSGITVGFGGECHYTNDAGESWPNSPNVSACPFGLDIVNEKIAWHCGNLGEVRQSFNGGQSWVMVTDFGRSEPNQCRFLSFIDENIGWIAAPDLLGMTKDGGTTWTRLARPDGIGSIAAICLRTANEGYLLNTDGIVFITNDAGKTWISVESGLKDEYFFESSAPAAVIRFTDADHGIVVASLDKGKVVASLTNDGGKTWSREEVPSKMGNLYLAHDGRLLTIFQPGSVTVYKRNY